MNRIGAKARVNPKIFLDFSPMAAVCVIAKIVTIRNAIGNYRRPTTFPRFLWVTLWITMFTSRKSRTSRGLALHARQMTKSRSLPE
jgi:hypothetical protein